MAAAQVDPLDALMQQSWDRYQVNDWVGLHRLLVPQLQSTLDVPALRASFNRLQPVLGRHQFGVLVDSRASREGCREDRRAMAFEHHLATLVVEGCRLGKEVALTGFTLEPSFPALIEWSLQSDVGPRMGVGVLLHACPGDTEVKVGGEVDCWLAAASGQTVQIRYRFSAPGIAEPVAFEVLERVKPPDDASMRDFVETFRRRLVAGDFGAIHRDASRYLRHQVDESEFAGLLTDAAVNGAVAAAAGDFTWDEESAGGLPRILLSLPVGGEDRLVRLDLIHDRSEWALRGMHLDPLPGSATQAAMASRQLVAVFRKTLGAADAQLDCPVHRLLAGEPDVECQARAFGTTFDVDASATGSPGQAVGDDWASLRVRDPRILLRAWFTRLQPLHGFRPESLRCTESPAQTDRLSCSLRSDAGEWRLETTLKDGGIDVTRLQPAR